MSYWTLIHVLHAQDCGIFARYSCVLAPTAHSMTQLVTGGRKQGFTWLCLDGL